MSLTFFFEISKLMNREFIFIPRC
ncbi:hypothetical protein AYI68_g7770, partial [Smittium mucronatum]